MPDEPRQEDLDALTPELRAGVLTGDLIIVGPGQNGKPVVTDVKGKFVKGSGRPLNAPDSAYVSRTTAYRRSRVYSEAIEQLVSAWKNDENAPEAILSLEELISAAKKLAVPEPQRYVQDVECPGCGTLVHAVHIVDKAPDQKMLAFLIERLAGAAQKTTQVNVHSEEMVRIMSDSRVLEQIEVITVTPEERAARIRAVQEA